MPPARFLSLIPLSFRSHGLLWIVLAACGLVACGMGQGGGTPADSEVAEPAAMEAPSSPTLRLSGPSHHLDRLAREPMVAEHPDGTLFVSGYGSQVTGTDPEVPPLLWKSEDSGTTWERVDVGTAADGAAGNSDVDLVVASDGTVYFLVMGFDRSTREGTHIAIGVSHDIGVSWKWTRLSQSRFDDRPWVVVQPDGTAHAVWNDDAGISHAVSADQGLTWKERSRIHHEGGSSHFAGGPSGELALRISPIAASANRFFEGVDLVAVSTDNGETWSKNPAPGDREWDPTFSRSEAIPRWVEPLAWDQAGALFHLWSEGLEVRVARSLNGGSSWVEWSVAIGDAPAYFPFLRARAQGELAATWFSGAGDGLVAHLAYLVVPTGASTEPIVRQAEPFQIDAWLEVESDTPARTPAGEYIPVMFLKDGRLAVVSPIQDVVGDRWGFSWWTSEVVAPSGD